MHSQWEFSPTVNSSKNHLETNFIMKPGDCTAQMIIKVIATPEVAEVEDLDVTVRREGVFRPIDV